MNETKKLLWFLATFMVLSALGLSTLAIYLIIRRDGWIDVVLALVLFYVAWDILYDLYKLPPWRNQESCPHPDWKYCPQENAMYACGEDGAFAWRCTNCNKRVYTDDQIKPRQHDVSV
jgi:hypothetical protein